MKYVTIALISLLSFILHAQPVGNCKGTPSSAVTLLPKPLSNWGQIACTPYGHIITNKKGWVWSNPGSYSPVMIPSQMVRNNPELLANKSYFTQVEMSEVLGKEAEAAISLLEKGFDKTETKPKVYRLRVVSISGKSLNLKFFDYGNSKWGMWCNKGCDPNSRFMLLNMAKRPNK